jgi:tripartite-type tricarboxylate transporter receptor subunit TctC
MKLPRRRFLHLAAGAAALPALPRIARAQAYPSRPVRWIVGYPPGGATDIAARLMGQWLSERLGQPFVIENRPGASGNIGTEAAVNAAPDGYTLLLVNAGNAINATLYEKLNFDFVRDIAPVASIIRVPLVMQINPSVPVKTVPEFITYAKANPGKLNMASAGNGTPQHVSGELFKMMAGINMTHVPYRGSAPALTDLLGGHVQVVFDTTLASIEYIRAGRLRPLAVTTSTRLEAAIGASSWARYPALRGDKVSRNGVTDGPLPPSTVGLMFDRVSTYRPYDLTKVCRRQPDVVQRRWGRLH